MTVPEAAAAPSAGERVTTLRLYSITEAAEILNVPRTWLRDKVTARAVPHSRLGRHVRFTDAHLHEIVSAGESHYESAMEPLRPTRMRRRAATAEPAQSHPPRALTQTRSRSGQVRCPDYL